MFIAHSEAADEVVVSLAESLTVETLPERGTTRWVARRKAEVVAAIERDLISVPEACDRYELSLEELVTWQRAVEREGMQGLRASRLEIRDRHERSDRRQPA